MSIKFLCAKCGHHLKALPEQAGKQCKCTRCGHAMTIPAPLPVATPVAAATRKGRFRPALIVGLLAGAVAAAVAVALFLYVRQQEVGPKLNDLATGTPAARADALLWLAEATPGDAHRAQVTAALEPLLFEGDVRGNLNPDLLLRAYLNWANADNVPSLLRMVDKPVLPNWDTNKTALAMATLGKLKDARAADVLAAKLADPELHDQAIDALKVMGPGAEGAVTDYLFAADPAVRQRAADLLAGYGTPPGRVIGVARRMLTSNDPEARFAAAAWFADNPPDEGAQKADVAGPLAVLLSDLSPRVNGAALQALKVWGTKDVLPQVEEFARRQEKAGTNKEAAANNSAMIDLLAKFPDESAGEAVALRLKDLELRDKAAQALVQIGPAATGPVLNYLNSPDADVRMEARSLCKLLNVPADRQLDQTLADVAGTSKPRARAALQHLAQMRPDEASRAKVAKALNAPLLDPDRTIREGALDAVRVWATKDNSDALLKLLEALPPAGTADDARTAERVGLAVVAIGAPAEDAVIPLLKSANGLVRRVACDILGEIGTSKSVQPLESAGQAYLTIDVGFYKRTQAATAKVTARQ